MSRNEQKTPLTRALPLVALRKISYEIAKRGYPLPCHVVSVEWPMVTVNFDVADALLPPVQVPPVVFQYANMPIQVGEKGWVFPCPLYMGGVTGLGPTDKLAAIDELQHNLSALMWFPAANKKWTQPGNINAQTLWGPDGVVIQDKAGAAPDYSVTVNSTGVTIQKAGGSVSIVLDTNSITLTAGGHTVELNSTGILMDGHPYADHEHEPGTYVAGSTPVTLVSGGVVPGT